MNMTHRDSFLLQSSLSVLTLISVSTPPRVTAAARKRSRPFWQNAGGRLQLYMQTLLTERGRSGLIILYMHSPGTHEENELTRSSSDNGRPQSSPSAEPLRTDPRPKGAGGE